MSFKLVIAFLIVNLFDTDVGNSTVDLDSAAAVETSGDTSVGVVNSGLIGLVLV